MTRSRPRHESAPTLEFWPVQARDGGYVDKREIETLLLLLGIPYQCVHCARLVVRADLVWVGCTADRWTRRAFPVDIGIGYHRSGGLILLLHPGDLIAPDPCPSQKLRIFARPPRAFQLSPGTVQEFGDSLARQQRSHPTPPHPPRLGSPTPPRVSGNNQGRGRFPETGQKTRLTRGKP